MLANFLYHIFLHIFVSVTRATCLHASIARCVHLLLEKRVGTANVESFWTRVETIVYIEWYSYEYSYSVWRPVYPWSLCTCMKINWLVFLFRCWYNNLHASNSATGDIQWLCIHPAIRQNHQIKKTFYSISIHEHKWMKRQIPELLLSMKTPVMFPLASL